MDFKPKTWLYFIMKFRIRNDLHVVICTQKLCVSTCLTEETLTILLFWLPDIFDKFILFSSSGNDNVYLS